MWRTEDHTADACLVVEAESRSALYAEAVRAYGEWLGAGSAGESADSTEACTLRVAGADETERWVGFWRALHRNFAVEGRLAVGGRIAFEDDALVAELHCLPADELDAAELVDVKAVTWHEAAAGPVAGGGWCGRIVLDL